MFGLDRNAGRAASMTSLLALALACSSSQTNPGESGGTGGATGGSGGATGGSGGATGGNGGATGGSGGATGGSGGATGGSGGATGGSGGASGGATGGSGGTCVALPGGPAENCPPPLGSCGQPGTTCCAGSELRVCCGSSFQTLASQSAACCPDPTSIAPSGNCSTTGNITCCDGQSNVLKCENGHWVDLGLSCP